MDDKSFKSGDTRRTKRLKVEVTALFTINKSMDNEVRIMRHEKVLQGVTQDINEKGVAIATDIFLPLGAILDIEIHLNKLEDGKFSAPLTVSGRIVAIRPMGKGKYRLSIVFTTIDETYQKALEAYVKEKFPS
jgi:hypothetical protein